MAKIKGFELRGLKGFRGHEGEPLKQGNIYFDGRKVGFFSEDSHGGYPTIQYDGDRAQRDALEKNATIAATAYFEKYPEDKWGDGEPTEESFYSVLLALTAYEKHYNKMKKQGYKYLTIIREKDICTETMIAHSDKDIKDEISKKYDIESTKLFESETDFII